MGLFGKLNSLFQDFCSDMGIVSSYKSFAHGSGKLEELNAIVQSEVIANKPDNVHCFAQVVNNGRNASVEFQPANYFHDNTSMFEIYVSPDGLSAAESINLRDKIADLTGLMPSGEGRYSTPTFWDSKGDSRSSYITHNKEAAKSVDGIIDKVSRNAGEIVKVIEEAHQIKSQGPNAVTENDMRRIEELLEKTPAKSADKPKEISLIGIG